MSDIDRPFQLAYSLNPSVAGQREAADPVTGSEPQETTMAPKVADRQELNGFEVSILSVLAQLPNNEQLAPERAKLLGRLDGKARRIAIALSPDTSIDPHSDEKRVADALAVWGRARQLR